MTPSLQALYVNPAPGCNLHCRHCWVSEGSSTGDLLSIGDWRSLLSEASDLNCRYIKFTGGEPLLYKHFVPLYESAAALFPRLTIETNGTLQPEGLWNAFRNNRPENVSVSLDSSVPGVHDAFRGREGAWLLTVDFLERLAADMIPSQIIMSVADGSRKPVEDMILFADSHGHRNLKINLIAPSGRGKSISFYDASSIAEVIRFMEWLDSTAPEWVSAAVPAALLPVNRLKHLGYCPVRNLMGVLPDGSFSLCGVAFSRKEMTWGRYPEISINEAWNNSPVFREIRESIPGGLTGICARCIHRETCIGRCVVNNMETGGSLTSPDILCQRAWENGLFPRSRLLDPDE